MSWFYESQRQGVIFWLGEGIFVQVEGNIILARIFVSKSISQKNLRKLQKDK